MSESDKTSEIEMFAKERVSVAGKTGTLQLVFQNGATITLEKVYIRTFGGEKKKDNPLEIRGYLRDGSSVIVGFPATDVSDFDSNQLRWAFGGDTLVGAFFIRHD